MKLKLPNLNYLLEVFAVRDEVDHLLQPEVDYTVEGLDLHIRWPWYRRKPDAITLRWMDHGKKIQEITTYKGGGYRIPEWSHPRR